VTCAQFPLAEVFQKGCGVDWLAEKWQQLCRGHSSCKVATHQAVVSPATKMTNGPKGGPKKPANREKAEERQYAKFVICPGRQDPGSPSPPFHSLRGISPPWGSCRIQLAPATFDYFYDQMAFYCRRLLSISGPHIYGSSSSTDYLLSNSNLALKSGTGRRSGFLGPD